MKVLVTGGTGFTGSHLVTRLVGKGHQVRSLSRKATTNTDHFRDMGVETYFGNITEKDIVKKAVRGVELVYHLAAAWQDISVPEKIYWDVNVGGTQNVLDACLDENVDRVVHCSTTGVLGNISNPPADENYPYGPGDIYQETKCEGEKLALRYFQEKGLPGVVLRPLPIYGPGDLRMLRLFRLINNKKFIMIGKGNVHYQQVFVDDLITGFELCGEKKRAIGQVYMIGGNESPTLNELVSIIAEVLDVPVPSKRFPFIWPVWLVGWLCKGICKPFGFQPPIFPRRVDWFSKNRDFDISKAKKELGYEPKTDLRTGIKLTAEWYRNEDLL